MSKVLEALTDDEYNLLDDGIGDTFIIEQVEHDDGGDLPYDNTTIERMYEDADNSSRPII